MKPHSRDALHRELTERIIGAAIEVHKAIGPGLLESTYEECLDCELREGGLLVSRQRVLRVGLILNFNTVILPDGIHRVSL